MKKLLTVNEVAAIFSVSLRTIGRWQRKFRLMRPVRLTTHSVRWDAEKIERFIAQRGRNEI